MDYRIIIDGVALTIGMISGIVGIIIGWKILGTTIHRPQIETAGAPPVPPSPASKSSATLPDSRKSTSKPEPKPQTQPKAPEAKSPEPAKPTSSKGDSSSTQSLRVPNLKPTRKKKTASDRMRIGLTNMGSTLIYLRHEMLDGNELKVEYTPAVFRKEERYAYGTSLVFTLSGAPIEKSKYAFRIVFQDQAGNQYGQEIQGTGEKVPAMHPPKAIA
ncbi:hypothetical protein [Pontibacter sp. G13]|uniref:hypothetical protein n=1 Tax=Pontibacter sp. G13 TaxID=3074898 RepID=UPI002889D3B3|nr:hypothetical protein [Pontibacter sp. G13]WNJ16504.1 hypothetical protein RJD25_16685 [Pontibacter sp. G13]